ncbi:Solute carrier family 13 member 2 (Fragment), variant 2 [Balamuthia mandrillaris]
MESYLTLRHALEKEAEIARTPASEEETQMEEEQEEEQEKEKEKEAEEKVKERESSSFSIGRNDAFVLHLDDAEVWPADAAFVEAMRHRQQQRRGDMLTTDEDISEEDPTFVANVADYPFYYMVGLALALEEIMVEYPTLKVVISGENEYTAQTILTACTRNDQTWWHHMNMPIFTADAAHAICDHFYNFSPLPLLSLMQIYELIAYNGRTIQLFLREVMLVFHHNDSVERLMLSILQKCVDRVYINWSTALQKKYTSLMSNFKQRRVLPLQLLMTFRFASLYRARQLPDGSLEMLNVHFPVEWKNIAQCGVFHLREELRHRDERSGFQTTEGRAHTKAGLVHYVIISPPRGLLQRFWVKNAASCPRKDLLSLLRWHLIAEERYLNEDIIARGTLWKRALATELALPSLSMNLGFAPDVSSPSFSPLQRTGSATPVSPGSFASLLLCIWQKLDPMQATIAPDPASFNRSPVFLADEQTLQYTESFHHRIQCVLSNKGPLRGGVPSQVDLGLPFVDSSGKEVKVWARLVLGGLTGNDYQNLCINFFSKGRASTRTGDLTSPDQAHPQHFLRIFISGDNFLPVIPLNKLKLEVPLPSSPFAPATRTEQGRTSPRSPVGEELKSPSSEPIQEPIRVLATFHRMVDPDLRLSLFSIMEGAMALLSRCLMPLLLSPDVLSPEQDRFSRQADLMGADLRDMVQQVLPHLVDAGAKEIRTSTYASPPPTPTPKAEKVLFVRQPHDTRNTAMKEIIVTEFTVANLKEAAAEACGRAASDVVEITRSVSGAAGMKVAITSDRQVAKLINESIITVEFSNHEQVE